MSDDDLPITTRLARNGFDTIHLRGHDLRELIDDPFWSVVSVSLGNRRLTPQECRVVDAICNIVAIGDPRVWPLKVTRLVGSYGQFFTAVAAGYSVLDRANVGPGPSLAAAAFFLDAVEQGQTQEQCNRAICAKYDAALARKERVPAFGVAGRDDDERHTIFMEWLAAQPWQPGRCWRMFEAAVEHVGAVHGLKPNILGATGILPLDLGFDGANIVALASYMTHWGFVANAFEATRESPEILRRLPATHVRYVGPEPRLSPRAKKNP